MTKHIETERKFKLNAIPEGGEITDKFSVWQGYFNVTNHETGNKVELRIRSEKSEYGTLFYITQKTYRSHNSCIENEIQVDSDVFDMFTQFVGHQYIEKTRIVKEYKSCILEIDIFTGEHNGLILAEIELDESEIDQVQLPQELLSCLIEEVTGDKNWSNSYLAKH